MAKILLNDNDLSDLIFKIISPGKANEIEEMMKSRREGLAYKDYRVDFWFYGDDGKSTTMAEIHIWRKSRLMGWVEHNRIMKLLKSSAFRRYKDGGQVSGVKFRHVRGLLPVVGEKIEWLYETAIYCETDIEGWKYGEHGRKDIIVFKFNREFDK